MESQYPVTWAGKTVGEVTVTRQGLYYLFVCRAQLPAGSRCRLYACGESEPRDLGLLIPGGSGYELQTRVPAKYFEAGEYRFCLDRPAQEEFIPVSCSEPFPALDRLESGKFACLEGEPGIVFDVKEK